MWEEEKNKKRGRKVCLALTLWGWRLSHLAGGLGPVHKGCYSLMERHGSTGAGLAEHGGMQMPQKWKQVPEFFQWFLFFQHLPPACLPVAGNPFSQNLSLSTNRSPNISHPFQVLTAVREWETGGKDGSGQHTSMLGLNDLYASWQSHHLWMC